MAIEDFLSRPRNISPVNIFLDTGFFLAYTKEERSRIRVIEEQLNQSGGAAFRLSTTVSVVQEVIAHCNEMDRPLRHRDAVIIGKGSFCGGSPARMTFPSGSPNPFQIEVIEPSFSHYCDGMCIISAYPDLRLSLTDVVLVAHARSVSTSVILTVDGRHFRPLQRLGGFGLCVV